MCPINPSMRILSIGAHPADVFDQSGGTMAHHVARGDHVACVVLTHGARVHDRAIDALFHNSEIPVGDALQNIMLERSRVKADEVRRACGILGFNEVHFFGEDDAVLLVTEHAVKRLAVLIRKTKPDIVLTHFPREGDAFTNPHAIAGQIAMHALSYAASVDPLDKQPPHRAAQVFFFGEGAAGIRSGLWDASGGYYNDVFIDITDVVEKKLASLDCLISQGYAGAYARKRIETSDGAFGLAAGVAYAEGFIALRSETHYHLPVSDRAIQLAQSSDHEIMAKYSQRVNVD